MPAVPFQWQFYMGNQEPAGQTPLPEPDLPPSSGGNPPTTAPYNTAFEYPYSTGPSSTPYPSGIGSNPWASPTPYPGGPGGPPSISIAQGPYDPYQPNYDYGGNPFEGAYAGGFQGNPSAPGMGGIATEGLDAGLPGVPGDNVAPAQSVYPIDWGGDSGPIYADTKKKTTFMQDLGSDLGDIFGSLGHAFDPGTGYYSPAYLSSIGYSPGGGTGSLFPGSNTFVGGAFASPAGGSIGGQLGARYEHAGLGDWFARQSFARLRSGGDPTLGLTGPDSVIRDYRTFWHPHNPGEGKPLADILPRSQWGGMNASNAYLYSDQGQKPMSAAGITGGGGPGGVA